MSETRRVGRLLEAWYEGEEAYLQAVVTQSQDEHLVDCARQALEELRMEMEP